MTRISAAMVVLFAFTSPLYAADRDAAFFKEMDTNGDGVIDRDEYTLRKGTILYTIDANHNLKIERKETKLSVSQFKQYAGADGVIDGGEFFDLPGARFTAFDKNGDNVITREEFRRQLAEIRSGQQTAEGR